MVNQRMLYQRQKAGAWDNDILTDGHKCNMTDMGSSIGLVQLTNMKKC